MMKLYYYPGACSLSDHIVLEWTGAKYELVEMSRASVRSPDYLAINPGGTVPLLRRGDFLLTENVAILVYLAELYPDAKLLGDGTPEGRADVLRWLAFVNSDVHGAFKPIFSPLRYLPDETRSADVVDAARVRVRDFLVRLDAQLDGRDWLTGTRSIADPYLFVVTRWAIAKGIDMRGLDHLLRFVDRMYADRGVQAALEAEEGRAAA
jgi:glutathione S-transferase